MILAYALPPMWMMIAAVYLLFAVPIVFVISVLMFSLKKCSIFYRLAFLVSILAFSILNLGLTCYFFFWLRQPGENLAMMDWGWILSVISSTILLGVCCLRAVNAKQI